MSVTSTVPDVWQLEYDDQPDEEFSDGLRLSTDCVVRRLIEPLDAERYFPFPEHLGKRGHGFERIMQEWLAAKFGVVAHREVVVPWEYGESHLDLWIPEPAPAWDTGGRPLQVELKANKEAQVKTENVRQVQRQMFAMERAIEAGRALRYRERDDAGVWRWHAVDPALYADADWRIVVIDPTTWRIPNPKGVRVTISDTRRKELEAEWATMQRFMAMPAKQMRYEIHWPERIGTCSCGNCDAEQVLHELPRGLAENAALYNDAVEEKADAERERVHHAGVLAVALKRIEDANPNARAEEGTSWVGGGWKVTLSKPNAKGTRSVRVTKSEAKASVQI